MRGRPHPPCPGPGLRGPRPGMRLCDIAIRLGITEYSATGITTAGCASNDADDRHNRYRIQRRQLKSKGLVRAENVAAAGPGRQDHIQNTEFCAPNTVAETGSTGFVEVLVRPYSPRLRPMISFWISVVPPKIDWTRLSAQKRPTRYSRM
jgi:hypothetical protein